MLRKDATVSTINCKKISGGLVFQKQQISQHSRNAWNSWKNISFYACMERTPVKLTYSLTQRTKTWLTKEMEGKA